MKKILLEDKIPGGVDAKNLDKYMSRFDSKEVAKGIEVESEHTKDKKIAKEIASDHLAEDPHYYAKLAKVHKESINVFDFNFHDILEVEGKKQLQATPKEPKPIKGPKQALNAPTKAASPQPSTPIFTGIELASTPTVPTQDAIKAKASAAAEGPSKPTTNIDISREKQAAANADAAQFRAVGAFHGAAAAAHKVTSAGYGAELSKTKSAQAQDSAKINRLSGATKLKGQRAQVQAQKTSYADAAKMRDLKQSQSSTMGTIAQEKARKAAEVSGARGDIAVEKEKVGYGVSRALGSEKIRMARAQRQQKGELHGLNVAKGSAGVETAQTRAQQAKFNLAKSINASISSTETKQTSADTKLAKLQHKNAERRRANWSAMGQGIKHGVSKVFSTIGNIARSGSK